MYAIQFVWLARSNIMGTKYGMSSMFRAIWFRLIGLTYHNPFALHVPNTGDTQVFSENSAATARLGQRVQTAGTPKPAHRRDEKTGIQPAGIEAKLISEQVFGPAPR
jgi:hypothetical protein